jgi:hypothetical protein
MGSVTTATVVGAATTDARFVAVVVTAAVEVVVELVVVELVVVLDGTVSAATSGGCPQDTSSSAAAAMSGEILASRKLRIDILALSGVEGANRRAPWILCYGTVPSAVANGLSISSARSSSVIESLTITSLWVAS